MNSEQLTVNSEKKAVSQELLSSHFDNLVELSELEIENLFPVPCSLLPDLQWFSDADDENAPGKTEQPTEHKIKRLREEGQVVKSQELVGAIGIFIPALLILFLAPFMLRTCVEMIRFFLSRAIEMDPTQDRQIALVFFRYFAILASPILVIAVFSAIFSNVVQVGFKPTTKPIIPKLSKITPKFAQFFKRIFSVDGIYNFIKSIIKMAIIGGVSFVLIRMDINKLLNLQKADPWIGLNTVASIAIKMLLIASVLLLILAIPDYMFQKWRFRKRNMMTRYEVKEETKMYEADPQIQARIRQRFRELLRQNIAQAVPNADVVITNPTHYAIALKYEDAYRDKGPMVVAKGADEMAAKIREIANEHEVPLVENKPLAQALYRETETGDFVPEVYWSTVAVILNKVWQLNEARRNRLENLRKSA